MNRDGTPETELEEFILNNGLGWLVLSCGAYDRQFTLAQTEALEKSKLEPFEDAAHRHVFDIICRRVERIRQRSEEVQDR